MKNQISGKQSYCIEIQGTDLFIPVTRIQGIRAGETITLSAGVHSREYIGIQALSVLAEQLKPEQISGTILILHCCNYEGFIRRSADVFPADHKNLNRCFPGNEAGSETERTAYFLEHSIISDSDYIVDLHSGGFCESLIPHVYFHGSAACDVCERSRMLAELTGVPYIVRSRAENGFYSRAGQCGVPAIIVERGGCGLVNPKEVQDDIRDVRNILRGLGFLNDGIPAVRCRQILIEDAFYEDSPISGCWHPNKIPGDLVSKDEKIGEIRDIYGNHLQDIRAKSDGRILYQTVSLGIEAGTPMVAYTREDIA